MENGSHTTGPWIVSETPMQFLIEAPNDPDNPLRRCVACTLGVQGQSRANAEFIVRSCNAHEALLGALRQAVPFVVKLAADHEGSPETGLHSRAMKLVGVMQEAIAKAA